MSLLLNFKSKIHEQLAHRFSKLDRWRISTGLLRGQGIEIGAMYLSLKDKKGVTVKYLDRISKEVYAKKFPSIGAKLVRWISSVTVKPVM